MDEVSMKSSSDLPNGINMLDITTIYLTFYYKYITVYNKSQNVIVVYMSHKTVYLYLQDISSSLKWSTWKCHRSSLLK